MLLTIDTGNTTTEIAVFNDAEIVFKNRLATPSHVSERFIKSLITSEYIDRVTDIYISSVVPLVDGPLSEGLTTITGIEPVFINHKSCNELRFMIDRPETLGADIIAGLFGAMHFFKPPFLVIDSGTATTFGAVDANCNFIGGAILPGVDISIKALANNAAKLNKIRFTPPDTIVGTNTADCINSGIYHINVGGINHMINEFQKILSPEAGIVLTGGAIRFFSDKIGHYDLLEPSLIHYGLYRISRNKKS